MDSKQVKPAGRKPPAAGMGRKKGSVNKTTGALKEMILEALNGVGGIEYLEKRANDPKTASAFLTLIGKVLPLQVTGAGANGEHLFQAIERRIVKADDKHA